MPKTGTDPELDGLLADWTTPPPSAALREAIVASARARPQARGVWWAGAAGLGLAGAAAGAAVALLIAPAPPSSPGLDVFHAEATVFGDLDDGSES